MTNYVAVIIPEEMYERLIREFGISSVITLGSREIERLVVIAPTATPEVIHQGNLCIDPQKHRVTLGGKPINLTKTEFRILLVLAKKAGAVASSREIVTAAEIEYANIMTHKEANNIVKVHIRRMRQKLGRSIPIHNIRGVGYMLDLQNTPDT